MGGIGGIKRQGIGKHRMITAVVSYARRSGEVGGFEGVCLTPVILATVRGEGRLRAAGRYVVSTGLPGSAGKQK